MTGFDREPMLIAPYVLCPLPRAAPRFRWRSDSVHALHAAVECSAPVGRYFVDVAAPAQAPACAACWRIASA